MRRLTRLAVVCAVALAMAPLCASANEGAAAKDRGPITNLPLPRYVSIKASEANARRGPSLSHKIDWVFKRKDMPVQITAEYGHWRRIQDRDGAGGWIHYSLLSGVRTVIVEEDLMALFVKADPKAPIRARLERGVVARLGACEENWCRLSAAGYKGWAPKTSIWGVDPHERRD